MVNDAYLKKDETVVKTEFKSVYMQNQSFSLKLILDISYIRSLPKLCPTSNYWAQPSSTVKLEL